MDGGGNGGGVAWWGGSTRGRQIKVKIVVESDLEKWHTRKWEDGEGQKNPPWPLCLSDHVTEIPLPSAVIMITLLSSSSSASFLFLPHTLSVYRVPSCSFLLAFLTD